MSAVINGTNGITFPTWTTATRPSPAVAGQAGYNTDIGAMETYTGSTWSTSDLPATGSSGNFLQSTGTAWTSASTLGVANGGTGANTLTSGSVLVGNGTGAVTLVAAGTSGNILKSNGTTWTSAAAAAGGFSNMTVFTSPGTFTTPATTTQIKVTVVAGGGGGNGTGTTGAGTGGTSSFSTLASATGGTGTGTTNGGTGGTGTAGTLQLKGGYGFGCNQSTPDGMGGSSIFGFGSYTAGVVGLVYGGGGGGAVTGSPSAASRGGSGGGGTSIYVGPVSASTGYAVTVGAGGTGAAGGLAGGAGVVIVEY